MNLKYSKETNNLTYLSIKMLRLSNRSHKWLREFGIYTIEDLSQYDESDLLQIPNIGATSANEIIYKLNLFWETYKKSENASNYDNELTALRHHYNVLGLSFRACRLLKTLQITTIEDLIRTPIDKLRSQRTFGNTTIEEIKYKLGNYLVEEVCSKSLAFIEEDTQNTYRLDFSNIEDFTEKILASLTYKQAYVAKRRYGLLAPKETLELTGQKLGLTRERVRQIQNSIVKKLRSFNKIHNVYPQLKDRITNYLKKNNNFATRAQILHMLSRGGSNINTLDNCFNFINIVFFPETDLLTMAFEQVNDVIFLDKKIKKKFNIAIKQSLQIIYDNYGSISKQNFVTKMHGLGYNIDFIKQVLRCTNKITETEGSLYININSKMNTADYIEKALGIIGEPAHFTQIALVVDKLRRRGKPTTPRYIHASLVRNRNRFVWTQPGVYGLALWRIKRVPFIKEIVIELLSDVKEPVHIDVIKQEVLAKSNCKESSVLTTLETNGQLFVKHNKGFFSIKEDFFCKTEGVGKDVKSYRKKSTAS